MKPMKIFIFIQGVPKEAKGFPRKKTFAERQVCVR
jgi:hypothetical protein